MKSTLTQAIIRASDSEPIKEFSLQTFSFSSQRSLTFLTAISLVTTGFGAGNLQTGHRPKLKTKPTVTVGLPAEKIQLVLTDPSVQKLTTTRFAWIDLDNKKMHLFVRGTNQLPWNYYRTFSVHPGSHEFNPKTGTTRDTPTGDYLSADKGKLRHSTKYEDALLHSSLATIEAR